MKRVAITVYKRRGNSWDRYIFKNTHISMTDAVREESGGLVKGGELTARIFSPDAEIITPGDRVAVGVCGINIPDNTLLVKEVKKNLAVAKKHIRITAV